MNHLVEVIISDDDSIRNQSLESLCDGLDTRDLLQHASELDQFRRESGNLYHRVRALFFIAAIYRYYLPKVVSQKKTTKIPYAGYQHLLKRRFVEAIDLFLETQELTGPSDGLSSALADAYHQLAFQTLADQVRRSVRTVKGNQWMFRLGHPADHPLRIRPELLQRGNRENSRPTLREQTAVRMDFSHSAWSDIFFLGMDFPQGARVLNASIDLAVCGRDKEPKPPIETYLRVIDEPVIRLVSVDLGASAELHRISEVFDFASDYLGLLKAAIVASGIVPPGLDGSNQTIQELLRELVGPGNGLELVSQINDIPKGSRACGLDQSFRLTDFNFDACDWADFTTFRSADRTGPTTRWSSGDSRRMDWWKRRRLARLWRCLAGHQTHRRSDRWDPRRRVWYQPRSLDAKSSSFRG